MNISILGTGNMAKGLAAVFAQAGHQVVLANRDAAKAEAVAAAFSDGVSAAGFPEAAASGDVVVIAVPYDAAPEVAGDDPQARKVVSDLATSAGFAPLETGGLASSRYLEPVAGLNIALGSELGHGTDIAPTWQRAA